MDKRSAQQEILLVTGTSFVAAQWEKNEPGGESYPLSERQRLEEACWNGLLGEMLPEICDQGPEKLYLWRIKEGNAFIDLELGDAPVVVEGGSSIDPYAFLALQSYN